MAVTAPDPTGNPFPPQNPPTPCAVPEEEPIKLPGDEEDEEDTE